ncbi:MAG: O-methyltransferase [Flavobacteriales bacterium]
MNLIVEGIKYQLHAKKRQGIHSPFVYELADVGLQICLEKEDLRTLNRFDSQQKRDQRQITITDLGAGSKTRRNQRTINQIHKNSSSGKRYGALLYRLCKHFEPARILELGTSLGRGSLAMHLGNPAAELTSIEGSPEIAAIARENMNEFATNPSNIYLVESSFSTYLSTLDHKTFDLVYIDGHHQGEALCNYLDLILPYTHEQTLFLLDDIRWNDDMFMAWNKLVSDKRFHLSIDFFRMGLLSRRPMQAKEHFVLKC